MNFDSGYLGPQGVTDDELEYRGSRYAELRARLFASAYYRVWGAPWEAPLPVYAVTLGRALRGVASSGGRWPFQRAARRSVVSRADWRPGPDGRGFRRILHPNGVCLFGTWEIDPDGGGTSYTGYFRGGSRALVIGRYSTCCTETRGGRYRSLALVGKLFPTTDPNHPTPLSTANFITQEDLGGTKRPSIEGAELRNAPDTSPWRRGAGLPVLLLTGVVLLRADAEPTIRQVYPVAELGKPSREETRAPEFMRLAVEKAEPPSTRNLDFREEILGRIYQRGDPVPRRTLTFHIEVSDEGRTFGKGIQYRFIRDWKRIGRIVFREAVASYAGDFQIHFQHPPWRKDRNDPSSLAR
jgi:hypothetical protein